MNLVNRWFGPSLTAAAMPESKYLRRDDTSHLGVHVSLGTINLAYDSLVPEGSAFFRARSRHGYSYENKSLNTDNSRALIRMQIVYLLL